MAVRYLVLLAVLALQGCITGALWYKEEFPLELQTVLVPCEVLEVTTSADADDPSIRVLFSPRPASEAPLHLTRFDSDRPGLFELQPGMTDGDWRKIPGAELLNLRSELQNEHALLWESRCLQAFQTHDWMELLSPTWPRTGYRPVPLAWVDGDLNVIGTIDPSKSGPVSEDEEIRARLRGLRLLARLDDSSGKQHYVLIGVPVLLQGTDLHLQRVGASVHWSRSQLWTARLYAEAPDAADRIPLPIPLRGQRFECRWLRELEKGELALDILRALATPITAVLDFAIMTNEPLSRLARFLSGDDKQAAPFEPTIHR